MSLELVNTFATLGTFLVIAATAIAAIVQLRHARSSNQIAAINELRETRETPEFVAASQFVLAELPSKLRDPAFRYQVGIPGARTDENRPPIASLARVGNYYEAMGIFVKTGLVEKELVLDFWCGNAVSDWKRLAPATAILRREQGQGLWENFEYLAVLAQDFDAAHPSTYPAGVRHIELEDEWLEADRQYATSLATT